MMRCLIYVSIAALAAPAGSFAGDFEALQGKWVGRTGRQKEVEVTLELKDHKVAISLQKLGLEGAVVRKHGEFKVDERSSPKAWDFLNGAADDGSKLPDTLAIYKLEGGTLTLQSSDPKTDFRPSKFKEDDPMYLVLRKVKD